MCAFLVKIKHCRRSYIFCFFCLLSIHSRSATDRQRIRKTFLSVLISSGHKFRHHLQFDWRHFLGKIRVISNKFTKVKQSVSSANFGFVLFIHWLRKGILLNPPTTEPPTTDNIPPNHQPHITNPLIYLANNHIWKTWQYKDI